MLAWSIVAAASPPDDAIVQPLTEGVTIDWTALELQIRASESAPQAKLEAIEERARRKIAHALARALPDVPLTATQTLGDVLDAPEVGPPIQARSARWQVIEARYAASGEVMLTASVSLASIVKPWVLDQATPAVDAPEPSPFTGILVDARAADVTPAVAPRIVTEGGQVVFDGSIDAFSAVTRAPVRYVPSTDHPHYAALGPQPWRLLVTAVQGGVDLVVANVPDEERRQAAPVIRTGEIIIVVRRE